MGKNIGNFIDQIYLTWWDRTTCTFHIKVSCAMFFIYFIYGLPYESLDNVAESISIDQCSINEWSLRCAGVSHSDVLSMTWSPPDDVWNQRRSPFRGDNFLQRDRTSKNRWFFRKRMGHSLNKAHRPWLTHWTWTLRTLQRLDTTKS